MCSSEIDIEIESINRKLYMNKGAYQNKSYTIYILFNNNFILCNSINLIIFINITNINSYFIHNNIDLETNE